MGCADKVTLPLLQDVKAKSSIAIHHGTLGWDGGPMDEPRHLLREAAAAAKLPQDAFRNVQHGAVLRFPGEDRERQVLLALCLCWE